MKDTFLDIRGPGGRVKVKVDGYVEAVPLGKLSTEAWQATIDGGFVQCVRVKLNGKSCQIWFDEDGLMKGLPTNHRATSILRGKLHMDPGRGLVGPVVIAWGKGKVT